MHYLCRYTPLVKYNDRPRKLDVTSRSFKEYVQQFLAEILTS